MRLLALDAATDSCSVALLYDGEVVERGADAGKAHSEQLLGMVAEILAERKISLADLDGIAATIGPGAFTGVRIGVAVAQGLAYGAGLRVAAVSTLEALAVQAFAMRLADDASTQAAGAELGVIACLDARLNEVYWGCFRYDASEGVLAVSAARVSAPGDVSPPARPFAGIGRGFAAYPVLASLPGLRLSKEAAAAAPRASDVARLGALRFGLGRDLAPAELQPIYLRDNVALTEAQRAARQSVI